MGLATKSLTICYRIVKGGRMIKKVLNVFLLAGMIIPLSGCIALLAGAGGTVFWQAGKVISEESVSIAKGVQAVESAFEARKITLIEKITKSTVTQLRGKDRTNEKVAVDVFDKGPKNVRIEIRYGLGNETLSRDFLNEIKRRL